LKKLALIILACTIGLGAMTSCSGGNTITMATHAAFPPFEYVTDRNKALVDEFSGVDVAIAMEIAKETGKTLKVENMDFDSVLVAVPSGKVDFAAAGMTMNETRAKTMDFSDPYLVAVQYIIVKGDNTDINSAKDLVDKRVGAVTGYTGYDVCSADLGIKDLQGFKQGVDAISELKNGKIDAVVIDSFTANALVAKNPDLKVIQDPTAFEDENYAIAVKKGNKELLDKINSVLKRLKDSGELDQLVQKYSEEAVVQ